MMGMKIEAEACSLLVATRTSRQQPVRGSGGDRCQMAETRGKTERKVRTDMLCRLLFQETGL